MGINLSEILAENLSLNSSDLWQGSRILILEISIFPSFRNAYVFLNQVWFKYWNREVKSSDLKFYNFDTFSSVRMRQRNDLFKRKCQAEALIYCAVLSPKNFTDVLIFQFSTGFNLIIVINAIMVINANLCYLEIPVTSLSH